jgi:hypothetical protein
MYQDNYKLYVTSNHEALVEISNSLRQMIADFHSFNSKYACELEYGNLREDYKYRIYDV